jgi:hypothetical protein
MRAFLSCFAMILLLPQCGGGTATSAEPKSSADSAESRDAAGHGSATEDDNESATSTNSASEKPQGPSCDDGTCSLCGSGICPSGWYCDEKASGGGACSWLTECAEKPTCACVTRVLGSKCKCREEGGGLKVACD